MRPNILLVVFDTARADVFEPYGAPRGSTPTVTQLAEAGGVHRALFSSGCWTVPAHASLFSGLLPRAAGVGHQGGGAPQQFAAALRTLEDRLLPGVLGRNGYETKGLSANLWVSAACGFDTGFEEFTYVQPRRRGYGHEGELSASTRWYLQALQARIDDGAEDIERTLTRWATDRGRRPFFWFVNLIECHSPYLPPRPFNPLSPLGRLRAARDAASYLNVGHIWRCNVAELDVPEAALRRMRRLYDASVRQMDAWLARVLDLLDRHGLVEETQVVVTSDHGENFGEGGKLGHAFSLDDRLLRLPFVTAGPAGLTIPSPAGIASVPGWLMSVAGIEDHPYREGTGPDGVAVAQFDAPGTPGHPRLAEALESWRLSGPLAERATRGLSESYTCATDGELKLLRFEDREELVDLASDPMETCPGLVGPAEEQRHGERLFRLRSAIDRAQQDERLPVGEPAGSADADGSERAALEEQMRLLGYL